MQWVYGERQVEIEAHHEDVEFLKDANIEDIYESLDPNDSNLLVIDDQMSRERKYIEKLFTQGSHHKNLTVIMLVQNLFQKELRTISLNSHYIVLMKNSRDRTQIRTLGQQMFPENPGFIVQAYDNATRGQQYGHLVIDNHPSTEDDSMRIVSRVLGAGPVVVYQPNI